MRILLLNDFSTATGGAELITLALRDGLRARGHDARLLASRAEPLPAPRRADVECFGWAGRLQPLWEPVNPAAVRALARELREQRPDVVHLSVFLWQLSPAVLPLLRDVPTVFWAMSYKAVCPVGTKLFPDGRPCDVRAGTACLAHRCLSVQSWLPRMAQRALWRRWRTAIDRIVPIGEPVRRALAADGIAAGESIPPGVDPRPPRPPLADPPIVGYAGRLVREKGVDVLLRAFAALARERPAAVLEIIGDGPERERLEALAGGLGLGSRVRFAGLLDPAAAERRLDGAWVQAVPSLWREPFGLVAIEAMMRGTALVATDAGEPGRLVVEGGAGRVVPAGDAGALAGALGALLDAPETAERLGRAGRVYAVTHFQRSMFLDRFERLYRSLAKDAG